MRKIRSTKWWAHITVAAATKALRWEITKAFLVFFIFLFFCLILLPFFHRLSSLLCMCALYILYGCRTHQTKWTFQRIFRLHHIYLRWFNCPFCHIRFSIFCWLRRKGCDHLEKLTFWTFVNTPSEPLHSTYYSIKPVASFHFCFFLQFFDLPLSGLLLIQNSFLCATLLLR